MKLELTKSAFDEKEIKYIKTRNRLLIITLPLIGSKYLKSISPKEQNS